MRGKVRLAILLAAVTTALARPAMAEPAGPAAPASARNPMAAAHAETVKDARVALAALAEARAAGLGGVSEDYLEKMRAYASARSGVMTDAGREAEFDPAVAKLAGDYDIAYRAYAALVAAPDTTAVELGEAQDRRLGIGRALLAARNAATARQFERLQSEGFSLPEPMSPELWAKGQTAPVEFMPQIVAIHGQEYTEFPDAPWQVELIDLGSQRVRLSDLDVHICGGALIRADWVLTAAHCVWNRQTKSLYDISRLRVRGGSSELGGKMRTFGIDAVRLPGGARRYVPSTSVAPAENDIALLHITPGAPLNDGKVLTTIAYAPARHVLPTEHGLLTVTGWGATVTQSLAEQDYRVVHNGRLRMSPTLRVAPLEAIGEADCYAKMRDRIRGARPNAVVKPPPASTMCAGSPLTGTCVGDSGGPLVAHAPRLQRRLRDGTVEDMPDKPVLVGIVSWGVGCQDFTVFTRVSAFNDWIAATLAERAARPARRAAAR